MVLTSSSDFRYTFESLREFASFSKAEEEDAGWAKKRRKSVKKILKNLARTLQVPDLARTENLYDRPNRKLEAQQTQFFFHATG
jgi:hypothetical protein